MAHMCHPDSQSTNQLSLNSSSKLHCCDHSHFDEVAITKRFLCLQDVEEDQQLLARLVHQLGAGPGGDTDAQFEVLSAAQVSARRA